MATGLTSWYGTVGLTVTDGPPARKKSPPPSALYGGAAPTVKPEAEEISAFGQKPGAHPSAGSVSGNVGMGAPELLYGRQERYESTYQATICEKRPMPRKPREGKMVFDGSTVVGGMQPVRTNLPARLAAQMKRLEGSEGTNKVREERVGMYMATLSTRGGSW
jgi:hypothetical protein